MVGTVLRKNGRIEFYSDFMLTEEHYDKEMPCVDIETDADVFYYKFIDARKTTRDEAGNEIYEYTFRKIDH